MWDVDLFVGVASIGNDPNWVDGSERVGTAYSFLLADDKTITDSTIIVSQIRRG